MSLQHTLEIAIDRSVELGEFETRHQAIAAARTLLGNRRSSPDDEPSLPLSLEQVAPGDMLDALLRSTISFAIIVTDLPGNVVAWNAGATRILGWTFAEMDGESADVFFTPQDVAAGRPHQEMIEALERGHAPDKRFHMRKDGSRFLCTGYMMPLLDENQRPLGFIKIAIPAEEAAIQA